MASNEMYLLETNWFSFWDGAACSLISRESRGCSFKTCLHPRLGFLLRNPFARALEAHPWLDGMLVWRHLQHGSSPEICSNLRKLLWSGHVDICECGWYNCSSNTTLTLFKLSLPPWATPHPPKKNKKQYIRYTNDNVFPWDSVAMVMAVMRQFHIISPGHVRGTSWTSSFACRSMEDFGRLGLGHFKCQGERKQRLFVEWDRPGAWRCWFNGF